PAPRLAPLAVLRRRGRRSQTGGHLDRRQRTPPGPCDLEAEQSHDHTQHHVDDRPAPHQVAPGWSDPPAGGGGCCAPTAGGGTAAAGGAGVAAGGGGTAAAGGGGATGSGTTGG